MASKRGAAETMSVEELASRVVEVEQLAALGCRLAREALDNPDDTAHTQERLQSILREVGELIPALHLVGAPVDASEFVAPSAAHAPHGENEGVGGRGCDRDASIQESAEKPDEGDPDWELDPAKLETAIQSDALMAQIPEVDREWFKGLARRVIESHARATLATRVREALGALYATMDRCQEETSKRLGVALTLEHLRQEKARKLD